MYKYHKELENRKEYYLYLKTVFSCELNRDRGVRDAHFDDEVLSLLRKVGKRVMYIDTLISGLNEVLMMKSGEYNRISYQEYIDYGNFFQHKENYYEVSYYYKKLSKSLDMFNLRYCLYEYSYFCDNLKLFFKDQEPFFRETCKLIDELVDLLDKKSIIKVPKEKPGVKLLWPDAWYITPHDFLFNTGCGHKNGNLFNPFWHIEETLKRGYNVPKYDTSDEIKNIISRGFITNSELRSYANLIYDVITIETPEVMHARECFENIIRLDDEKAKDMLLGNYYSTYERSYQPNIFKLIIGYYDALMCLHSSFRVLNNSNRKKEIIEEIKEYTNKDMADILVRFCGFSKVESTVDKTITTSSLYAIDDFKEYLDRGYTIEIVPGIVYDNTLDDVSVQNLSSPFIEKYLECKLSSYNGKGKVLIKR